jgi:hypothetical protein
MGSSKAKNWQATPPFVLHTLALIQSPAWTARPPALARILERLEIEHMRHAGTYNVLYVSYDQFVSHGVSKKNIRRTLQLGEDLGLLEVARQTGLYGGTLRPPNEYRLAYVGRNGKPPSDKWKKITPSTAVAALKRHRNSAATATNKKKVPAQPP